MKIAKYISRIRIMAPLRNNTAAVLLIALCSIWGSASQSVAKPLPFPLGETLTFNLKWQGIPAGKVILKVLPMATVDGKPVRHFMMKTRTSSLVDPFYKLRERIDAFTDKGMTRSVLYKKKKKRNSTRNNIVVNFDWEKNSVRYSNRGRTRPPVEVPDGAFDPLAVLYYYRSVELRENADLAVPVTDGKRWLMGKARIGKRETITLGDADYDTFRIEPDVSQFGGIFKKSPNAKVLLWVTADHRRIPVRISGKVSVGTIVCELVSEERS